MIAEHAIMLSNTLLKLRGMPSGRATFSLRESRYEKVAIKVGQLSASYKKTEDAK